MKEGNAIHLQNIAKQQTGHPNNGYGPDNTFLFQVNTAEQYNNAKDS
jgi:hypothetical protein